VRIIQSRLHQVRYKAVIISVGDVGLASVQLKFGKIDVAKPSLPIILNKPVHDDLGLHLSQLLCYIEL
jgi:hypothetical protein